MMSTSNGSGIEFSIVPEESQQHFRLLELPKELVTQLTFERPTTLQLKSRDARPGDTSPSNAVLCTPDKTYEIRQVNTSNTVYIAQATAGSDDSLYQASLQAIAQPQSTLELLPAANRSVAAQSDIIATLPVHSSTGNVTSGNSITKEDLFANIPASDAECEQAYLGLCCFELSDPRRCMRPSAGARLQAWKGILTQATLTGSDLTKPLGATSLPLLHDPDGHYPSELTAAMLKSMTPGEYIVDGVQIRDDMCATVVGKILLKDRAERSAGPQTVAEFTDTWKNLLPEKWRGRAQLTLLEGSYNLVDGGSKIAYVDNDTGANTAGNGSTSSEAKASAGTKRKWHEKFRQSRK